MISWRNRNGREPVALDTAFLSRLEHHVGATALREMLADERISVADRLAALTAAAETDARDTALRLAHDLTGSAGHAGLAALSATAASVQRLLADPAGPRTADAVAPLLARGRLALTALDAWLASSAGDRTGGH